MFFPCTGDFDFFHVFPVLGTLIFSCFTYAKSFTFPCTWDFDFFILFPALGTLIFFMFFPVLGTLMIFPFFKRTLKTELLVKIYVCPLLVKIYVC